MSELISAVAGGIISLSLSYVPGLSAWFAALTGVQKRSVLGAALLLASLIVVALSCAGYISGVPCSEAGFVEAGRALIAALIATLAGPAARRPGAQSCT